MSVFVRAANPEEVAKFKKILSKWSEDKVGALESKLGEKINLKKSDACDVYTISIDTLVEERKAEERRSPSRKDNLTTTPTVAHGSVNIWSKPTPTILSSQFQEMTVVEEIPGTDFYVGCTTCQEKGHTDCQTCQKTGKLVCGTCDGTRQHDCTDCNGYGFFDCADCGHTGFVDVGCSVCRDGKAQCDGCGGSGSTSLMGNNTHECRLCNGSGRTTCRACGGKGYDTVKCRTCNNGQIPCKTCRTQKVVTCQQCDQNGNVNCHTCKGKSILACTPCNSMGGFRSVENLVFKTTIAKNEVTVSPIEKVRDKIRLSFQDHSELVELRLNLDQIKSKISTAELFGPIEQVFTHVSQNRPQTTLLEKFSAKKALVLDFGFQYEDQEGHALLDYSSGLILVDKNPLEHKAANARESMKASYAAAKAKEDVAKAREIIAKARELKLKDLADSWAAETDAIEKKHFVASSKRFNATVRNPLIYGLGVVVWILAGLVVPMNASWLMLFIMLGLYEGFKPTPKPEAPPNLHRAQFHSQITKLSFIFVGVLALAIATQYFTTKSTTERTYKNGAPLTEVAP